MVDSPHCSVESSEWAEASDYLEQPGDDFGKVQDLGNDRTPAALHEQADLDAKDLGGNLRGMLDADCVGRAQLMEQEEDILGSWAAAVGLASLE